MGYTTDFGGSFKVTPTLTAEDRKYLTKFSQSRRMKRNMGSEYGIDGEFYVDHADDGNFGQNDDATVVDHNHPPRTQPGLWCQWIPTKDGKEIVWDGGEKFYDYVEWIQYLITNILKPKGYTLNGEVQWQGEDHGDIGLIVITNNVVATKVGRTIFN